MSSSNSTTEQNGGALPKHRACDECRVRKLACSKEADGCGRCKRENIPCNYSPQKPMGRPRKRPRDDANDADTATTENVSTKNLMTQLPPDTADPGLAFLSFLSGGDVNIDLNQPIPMDGLDHLQPSKAGWQFGYTGNNFTELNFDPSADQPTLAHSNIDPALFGTVETPPDAVPHLSPGTSSSPESSGSSPSAPGANCACTASLYLAIDSMQKPSSDITAALRQARLAAKTAYDVVNCPSCSESTTPLPHAPPASANAVHNFQNLMLLATLIPSIVHCYERILQLVDLEAARAQAERRQVPFKLQGYGGMWGPMGNGDPCGAAKMYDLKMMEPVLWRLTVRALLRVDVYGLSSGSDASNSGSACPGQDPFHLGLKDIIIQMENRSKSRHAIMDPLILSGAWNDSNCSLKMHKTGEKPTCAKIIEIARISLDNLVIA